jgi:hypothetical protein
VTGAQGLLGEHDVSVLFENADVYDAVVSLW